MAKKRTRKQKERTSARQLASGSFSVDFGAVDRPKISVKPAVKGAVEAKYFRSDLTKVIVLTMLALASEIALWLYLTR